MTTSQRWLQIPLVVVFCLGGFIFLTRSVFSEDCNASCNSDEECTAKINECNKRLSLSIAATKPHEARMEELKGNIDNIDKTVGVLTQLIAKKKALIDSQEQKLGGEQQEFEIKVRSFYEKGYSFGTNYLLSILLSGTDTGDSLRSLAYRQSLINKDKQAITDLVVQIVDLEQAKKQLQDNQTQLAAQKAALEVTLAPIRKLVEDARAYQKQLSNTVSGLSARQQELIAQKIGSLNLSRSASISMACSDDRNIDPGFSPRLAFYTYGIPHRVGMSQFGAYGRAKYDNQRYQDILRAYFSNINFEKKSNITIKVEGFSPMPLEQYMLGIYEVPDSWPMDALKAQAVAARSYALAYTNNGANSICTTQDCQVYKGGNKGGNWEQAVRQTEGEVMTSGGQPIKAWFSSTDGGYTHSSGDVFGGSTTWTKNTRDTSGDIGSINDLFNKAYDRESPCFYNAQGWRTQYNKSAWLRPEEVADIVNVILLSQANGGNAPDGVESWDADRVKGELRGRGGQPFGHIDNVSMSFDLSYGKTTSVTLSGDAGSKTFDGKTFKDYFNFRAPANIAIVGPLYNIERR